MGISSSGYYYKPAGIGSYNLELMNLIDEQYTKTPFYGIQRMTAYLSKNGHFVNAKRIRRLYHLMGIEAIYPKRKLSVPSLDYKYPYLLSDTRIVVHDHVWCADITYIRLINGFLYLFAIMDRYSRYILSWKLSNTLDLDFCMDGLKDALLRFKPDIFNSDQGSQFTSREFTGTLKAADIRISMDSRGRAYDNIFIERLWRSVKYEEVYIKSYSSVKEAHAGLSGYFDFYNKERLHASLGYQTPEEVYYGKRCASI